MVKDSTVSNVTTVDFDPFNGHEISHIAPVTEPQKEIWLSCLLGGDDACRAFNESITLRFKGDLDATAMELAFQVLVQRHDILRSVFSPDGKQTLVYNELPIPLYQQDVSTHDDPHQQIAAYIEQDALHLFDLTYGPLIKAGLFRLSAQAHCLVITAHHIIWDGWSKGVMVRDLGALYSAYAQNTFPELPIAPSFVQYAVEQFEFCQGDAHRKVEQFWLDQYKDTVPVLNLPIDSPPAAFRTFKSQRQDYPLDATLVPALKKLGLSAGCSYVTTVIKTFEVFLYRLTGQPDIVLGLPTAGQSITGHQHLVGHCVNLLPLRSQHDPTRSFVDTLAQRRQSLLDAYEHQQLTFGSLLNKLKISRDPSRVPMVPVVLNVDLSATSGDEFAGLRYQLTGNPRAFENFELFININDSAGGLTLECSYNTQLFRAATIDRMIAAYAQLLCDIVSEPSRPIGDLPFCYDTDLLDRVALWNATQQDYPRETPLHQLIAQTAAACPDAIALQFHQQRLSYRALDEKANQIARYLHETGVKPGHIVGVALDRSPELLIVLLAVMKAGAAYLPLDVDYPTDRTAFMLADSSAVALITSRAYANRYADYGGEHLLEDILHRVASYPAEAPAIRVTGNDLLYVLYTSGSTGKPKGVLIRHYNVVNFLSSMAAEPGLDRNDILLALTTISFDIAGLELFLPLLVGATILMADKQTARDPYALLDLIRTGRASVVQATPSTWQMLLSTGWNDRLPIKALCGGESLSKELADKLGSRCRELWNMYGPTETTIWSTVKKINPGDEITIGKPIGNTQVYILNEFRKPVPEGVVGEIYIAGDGVAQGYLNRDDLTAEKFVDNPFDARRLGGKMYRTGDLGTLTPSGSIQCLGRIDSQVKIRGHRIETEEIETVLLALDTIEQAVVVAREDQPGTQQLVAYVVPKAACSLASSFNATAFKEAIQAWKQHSRTQLPAYMVPERFVVMAELPLTPNLKIDRKALPAPATDTSSRTDDCQPPRTESEKLVAGIWQTQLGLEQLSVSDDFFDIGGHSLSAIKIIAQLEKETGKRLPPSILFEHSTVGKLASLIDADRKIIAKEVRNWRSLVLLKPGTNTVPLYLVHGANSHVLQFKTFASYMHPNQTVYGLQAKGVNGLDEPLTSVEAMATQYIDEILEVNPSGPYALAGFSFGGIVAYEMNRRLVDMGKEVVFLGMFDTTAEQSNHHDARLSRTVDAIKLSLNTLFFDLTLLTKDPKGALEYKWIPVKNRLSSVRRLFRKNTPDLPVPETPHTSARMDESYDIASREYRLRPQAVRIDLFRASRRRYYVEDFEYLGWKPFALGGVTIHEVPGEHGTLFDPAHVRELARIVQQALTASTQTNTRESSLSADYFASRSLAIPAYAAC